MGSLKFAILVYVIQLHHTLVSSTSNNVSCAQSCGNIAIRYPFRLTTDPLSCGDPNYQLSCQQNVTTLTYSSINYLVKAINYDNFTIRFSHSDVHPHDYCSLPSILFTINAHFTTYYDYFQRQLNLPGRFNYLYQDLVFVTCPNLNPNPKPKLLNYVDTSPCSNSSNSSYVVFGLNYALDLEDSCRLDRIYVTSFTPEHSNNISTFTDVCSVGTNVVQYSKLRSVLVNLEQSALGRLLIKLGWNPTLYFDLDLEGYIFGFVRYALLLFGDDCVIKWKRMT
ncbi:hypothetical protein M5689_020827 [Euphorbia peplus]|nr:hypothetical protein M5689_020827 [Euphorbia peplus]